MKMKMKGDWLELYSKKNLLRKWKNCFIDSGSNYSYVINHFIQEFFVSKSILSQFSLEFRFEPVILLFCLVFCVVLRISFLDRILNVIFTKCSMHHADNQFNWQFVLKSVQLPFAVACTVWNRMTTMIFHCASVH